MMKIENTDTHTVEYKGAEGVGYGWKCSCGAGTEKRGVARWMYSSERRWDAHEHLRQYGQQPKSCRGCCHLENTGKP